MTDNHGWADRLNQAALAYNCDDAGPTIEYPGLRIFVCLQPDGTLALNVWTKDTDEDPSLATPDDLSAHLPVELYRDDELVHRDAPTPFGGVNAANSAGPGPRPGSTGDADDRRAPARHETEACDGRL
ncbi:MAG: hypothetical protein HOW97_02990 [Catenulispora sp.]|nr:hypothetical protein [Catenulispora sp.]